MDDHRDRNEEDTSAHAKDDELARKLWDLTEKMVKGKGKQCVPKS